MEMLCVGFLIGALTAIEFFGSGVCYGFYQKSSDRYRGDGGGDSEPDRNNRSLDRYSDEEVRSVIQMVERYATPYEKRVLDQIKEDYEGGCQDA